MRGSNHDKGVREYQIAAESGVEIMSSFSDYEAVLSGPALPSQVPGSSMLPPRTRHLFSVISTVPGLSLEKLREIVDEPGEKVQANLNVLMQLGYVVRQVKNGEEVFQATMG